MILELQNLYDAEQQLTQALPQMLEYAQSDELKEALLSHLDETRDQSRKLEEVCKRMGIELEGRTCVGMEGLLEETTELMQEIIPSWTLDSGLIACSQKAEHYEIAGYGTAAAYAKQMGHDELLNVLLDILQQEKNADQKLTSIAEGLVNKKAATESEAAPIAL